jgi:ferredoxin
VFAVSNRQVSEAAGQGNNAAVGYHFGTKTDLVRAIEQKHRASIERLLARMVAQTGESSELRDWVACLVYSLTEHLAQLGNPTWYARFAAQALTDPAYHKIVIKDALASPSLVQVVDGITRSLPDLPMAVVTERNIMARNLMMHTCADFERAFAEGADVPRTSWSAVASASSTRSSDSGWRRSRSNRDMKVTVDHDKCVSSGLCVLNAADIFDQRDDDGVVLLLNDSPAPDQAAGARNAAAACPALAIHIEE